MKSRNPYLVPLILVTSLFFLWGVAHSLLDVLNKHFQDVLVISKARSALVQAMVYGGYFLMALPAGAIIRRFGYRAGIVTGLTLYGIGALMFIPGERIMSFPFFLLCLFVTGCGLTCLETSANPYVTVLGDKRRSASRLNMSQAFNGLGWVAGPMIGALLILGDDSSIALPYAIIGIVVLILALIFSRLPLPNPSAAAPSGTSTTSGTTAPATGSTSASPSSTTVAPSSTSYTVTTSTAPALWATRTFSIGVLTLLLYVAAQTGINSFFINYVTEADPRISTRTAALMLSLGGMGLFMVGRLLGALLMKRIAPRKLLLTCAIAATLCMAVTVLAAGIPGMVALCLTYLFESIMFPTIFSMAIAHVHPNHTQRASSFLIMSIVGGAIAPIAMGLLGNTTMALGFLLPLACFIAVALYALLYNHLRAQMHTTAAA